MSDIYAISDLHLGGAAPSDGKPGFQMCSERGRERLAEFIRHIRTRHLSPGVSYPLAAELIINGDFIDFLAEQPFEAVTVDEESARRKLVSVMQNFGGVFDALRDFVTAGGTLTLLLGNHDIELSLPAPRRELLARLGVSQIEFIYDSQALQRGPVLIEHGNRYDSWNAVDHDALRQLRSLLSRRESASAIELKAQPGSRLVIEVMNALKARYPFVDLLKPERENMLPLLAVLSPERMTSINDVVAFAKGYIAQRKVEYTPQGQPKEPRLIGAQDSIEHEDIAIARRRRIAAMEGAPLDSQAPDTEAATDQAQALAEELAYAGQRGRHIGAGTLSLVKDLWTGIRSTDRTAKLQALLRAVRYLGQSEPEFVRTGWESAEYLTPAQAAVSRGFKTVIYGHTHLLRRKELTGGGLYLNTGTWADLMFFPPEVFGKDDKRAISALGDMSDDLFANRLDKWRGIIPSYAHVQLGSGDQHHAELKVFQSADSQLTVGESVEISKFHGR